MPTVVSDLKSLIERVAVAESRSMLKSFLERETAAQHLAELGMTLDDARAIVPLLSDEDVLDLATRLRDIPDAGTARTGNAVSTSEGLLAAIAFLLFLIYMSL